MILLNFSSFFLSHTGRSLWLIGVPMTGSKRGNPRSHTHVGL